ncbi:hypothetical protein [Paramesorhizobium deserti]|nr:hypothetical protein [Paramesorhizobium deserti]
MVSPLALLLVTFFAMMVAGVPLSFAMLASTIAPTEGMSLGK